MVRGSRRGAAAVVEAEHGRFCSYSIRSYSCSMNGYRSRSSSACSACPDWAFLFVNNAVSVVMLSLILPRVSRQLGWWLSPVERDAKRDLAGALLVAAFYALWLIVFWQYQTRMAAP